jgi:uncharacterized integral membrane protein
MNFLNAGSASEITCDYIKMEENTHPSTAVSENEEKFISISLSDYKKHFYQALIPLVTVIILSFILVNFINHDLSLFTIKKLSIPIMAVLAILAFVHSASQKNKLRKLQEIEDFELKTEKYQKIYRFRLIWFLVSGFTCCFLYVFSLHNLFLYFALFDGLLLLGNYPNQKIFKKELRNNEIIFY